MIIILGPDHSGKTTLAHRLSELGLTYYHFTKDSEYEDYIAPLCSLDMLNAVLDRHIICEFPYSICMNRKFKFTHKQWHNILLLTLTQRPVIILCTNKPPEFRYSPDQYLPYSRWDECLRTYQSFLDAHKIPYMEYDYTRPTSVKQILEYNRQHVEQISWWVPMWKGGYGCIGSPTPKLLLVAERIGPNNMNNIPFETGPTGHMLSQLLYETATPLGKFAVTNLVKSYRCDPRPPNDQDFKLLEEELIHLNPKIVVFMGRIAREGVKIAAKMGIEHSVITHFGYYSHKGSTDVSIYIPEWRRAFGIAQKLSL